MNFAVGLPTVNLASVDLPDIGLSVVDLLGLSAVVLVTMSLVMDVINLGDVSIVDLVRHGFIYRHRYAQLRL